MSRLRRPFLNDRDIFVTVAYLAGILAIPQCVFAWGRKCHQIIVIVVQHYMRAETAPRMRELLAPESPEGASSWADEYCRCNACLRRQHGLPVFYRVAGDWSFDFRAPKGRPITAQANGLGQQAKPIPDRKP